MSCISGSMPEISCLVADDNTNPATVPSAFRLPSSGFTMHLWPLLLLLLLPWVAQAESGVIGSVKNAAGEAHVVRAQNRLPALPGMHLHTQDTLTTGVTGSLGIILRDDSLISLGPNSEMQVAQFQFDPASQQLSLLTQITRGTAAYLSGQISKLLPGAARVETPTAIIGVRGTHFVVQVDE